MTREALQQLRELLQEQSKGLTELMVAKLQEQRNGTFCHTLIKKS